MHMSAVRSLSSRGLLVVPVSASRITCAFGTSYITGGPVMPSERQSRLIVIAPEWLAGQVIRMRSTRMTVGRGQTDVYLDDPQVSRVHAALIARDRQLAVEDLGSLTGTTVNGMRIHTPQPLQMGDLVGFGPVLAFVDSDAANSSTALVAPSGQLPVPASFLSP
jgi:FHA domain